MRKKLFHHLTKLSYLEENCQTMLEVKNLTRAITLACQFFFFFFAFPPRGPSSTSPFSTSPGPPPPLHWHPPSSYPPLYCHSIASAASLLSSSLVFQFSSFFCLCIFLSFSSQAQTISVSLPSASPQVFWSSPSLRCTHSCPSTSPPVLISPSQFSCLHLFTILSVTTTVSIPYNTAGLTAHLSIFPFNFSLSVQKRNEDTHYF